MIGPDAPRRSALTSPRQSPTLPPPLAASVGPAGAAQNDKSAIAMTVDLLRVNWSIGFIGVFIYLFVIMTYLLPIGNIGIGLAVFGVLFSGRAFRFPPVAIAFAMFFAWAVLGSATTKYAMVSNQKLIDLGKVGLLFLALLNVVVSLRQLNLILVTFLTAFVLFPARGTMFNYFLYNNTVLGGRAAWRDMFGNANDMASACLLPLALAMGYAMTTTARVPRWASLAAIGMICLALLLTQSRGGLIAFAAFLALVLATQKRNRARTIVVTILLGGIVVVAAPGGAWERLSGLKKVSKNAAMEGVDREGSAAQRWAIWETAGRIIDDQPVLGVGFGGYPEANGRYSPELGKRDSHSTYLNVTAETGVVGLVLFLSIFWVAISRSHKVRRQLPPSLRPQGRRIQLVEFALYGLAVAAIWGSYGKMSLVYIHVAFLWLMTDALARMKASVQQAEQAAYLQRGS